MTSYLSDMRIVTPKKMKSILVKHKSKVFVFVDGLDNFIAQVDSRTLADDLDMAKKTSKVFYRTNTNGMIFIYMIS